MGKMIKVLKFFVEIAPILIAVMEKFFSENNKTKQRNIFDEYENKVENDVKH